MNEGTFTWIDQFDDHVVITDENAIVTHLNKAAEAATGYSREEIIGKKAGVLWGGNMRPQFYENMWRTIKVDKKPYVGIVRNRRRNGAFYFAELRIYPVLDDRGAPRHFIGIEPDVTAHAKQELMQENFVALVRHEMRNSLAAAKLMLSLLSQERLTPEQRELVESIDEENDRIHHTIEMLSMLGRSTDDIRKEDDETISLSDVIETAVHHLDTKKISLVRDVPIVLTVTSSRTIVEHVIENLISNAIKYSRRDGVVRIGLSEEASGVRFYCEDNGIGIPEDELAHLFDPFFRASNAREKTGSGIGLFVTKELLAKVGGRIEVASVQGEGTRAEVFFPNVHQRA